MSPQQDSEESMVAIFLTGGFSEQELTEAGASVVFDSVEHLREHLNDASLSDAVR